MDAECDVGSSLANLDKLPSEGLRDVNDFREDNIRRRLTTAAQKQPMQ